ncbi:hypothetical protein SR187_8750 [Streptococcus ruminantium]|uniref:Uncharacterized protein n=1 Tax=Streptococcus ruminantium TaxID=1917441 RepID=A0A2Z5U571_9STRE|nr:hypothetical protein SR187_8750 [Streptococcus ruminantium]
MTNQREWLSGNKAADYSMTMMTRNGNVQSSDDGVKEWKNQRRSCKNCF